MKKRAIESIARIQLNIPESIELKVEFIYSEYFKKENSTLWVHKVTWYEDDVYCKTTIKCFSPDEVEKVNYG